MSMALFHSFWTILLVIVFVGIWAWAWSGKRKSAFDEAARTPLEDDHELVPPPPGHSPQARHSGDQ